MAIKNGLNFYLPMYSVFVLVLIISGNYIGELLPCRVQESLTENILLKHFFAYLTLFFFVGLTDSEISDKGFAVLIGKTALIYVVFLFFIKTQVTYFEINLFLLGVLYLINYVKEELQSEYDDSTNEDQKDDLADNINILVTISNTLWIISLIILIIGFLVYMGQKKCEYHPNFDYTTFFFGKASCKGQTDIELTTFDSLKAAFGFLPNQCTNPSSLKIIPTNAIINDTNTSPLVPLTSVTSDGPFNTINPIKADPI